MLGFVVPIKPRAFSKDWNYDLQLLNRTAQSICGQTCNNFKLIIVYNEKPEISFEHENIIYAAYPYPPVTVSEIEDYDSYVVKYYNRKYAERMMDKGKKLLYGCKIAVEASCDYIMCIDSDDLISNKLAAFVDKRLEIKKAGWRIKRGYVYEENSSVLIKNNCIQNINGSTHVIRKDLINIPDFSSNIFWNYNLFEAHGYTYFRIKDFHNELLEDYPYFGTIYIIHKGNYSNILQLTKESTIKNLVKKIVKGKLISKSIRKEFHLFKLSTL